MEVVRVRFSIFFEGRVGGICVGLDVVVRERS